MKRLLMYFTLVIVLFNSCDRTTNSIVGENTLGAIFDGFFKRANDLIQQAQTTGLILELNGGAQVQNLIISARDAYKDDLNLTISALSAQQQQLVSSIEGILNKVQAGISDITSDLTQIALIIPGSDKFPQLTKYKGVIISPRQDSSVVVQLNGVFRDLARSGYEATIKINNKIFKPISKTTQELKFAVPHHEFKPGNNKINFLPFDIEVNYAKGLLFKRKKVANFNLYFVILPESFGNYVLETTKTVDTTLYEDKVCGPFTWNTHSGNDDGVPKGCSMENGWICDVSSVHPVNFRGEEGRKNVDWFDRGNSSSSTGAMWNYLATTRHGPFGNYGGLTVDLAYKRYKTTQVRRITTSDSKLLQWGDEKVLTFDPSEQWKLIFTQFDGKRKEIASSEQLYSYLKVNVIANRIEIKLAPFENL